MNAPINAALLPGKWLRTPEENAGDTLVYRPASHPLPPARWRDGVEFHPDGTMSGLKPGRTDIAQQRAGRWCTSADTLVLHWADANTDEKYRIVEATPDRLVLSR